MSADNGWILRRNEEGKYVLQTYFASDPNYPPIDDPRSYVFDTLDGAILAYEVFEDEDGARSEYGLSVHLLPFTPAKGVE